MNPLPAPELNLKSPDAGILFCLDSVIGVTIFDSNGLPKAYYGTGDDDDTRWVQAVFQALGLQLLLESAFQLTGFQYSIIHNDMHTAVVFRHHDHCVAFLLNSTNFHAAVERLAVQINNFNLSFVSNDPRFSVVVKP